MTLARTVDAAAELAVSDAPGERASWRPSGRALAIALLLGVAGGAVAALFVTVMEASGLLT